MLARLPLKGPILAFASVTLALGALARFAQRGLAEWQARSLPVAGAEEATAAQLGALAPLAGSLALGAEGGELAGQEGAPEEAPRPPRVHAPFAAEPALPRNLGFELRLADGSPLRADRVEVDQAGGDGAHVLNAYRDDRNPARWLAGSPGVTTGVPLSVRVRAFQGEAVWKGLGGFAAAPGAVGLELGVLELQPE